MIFTQVEVLCDAPNCEERTPAFLSRRDAMQEARKGGWFISRDGTMDSCPMHNIKLGIDKNVEYAQRVRALTGRYPTALGDR